MLALVSPCRVGAQDTAAPAAITASVAAQDTGFTRAVKGPDGQITAVQTAIRRLTPPDSNAPTVYLVAVTHIGEKSYYTDLQKLLDRQDLVLFEGVRPSKDEAAKPIEVQKVDREKSHQLQKRLSDDLGVQFQLEGIQYKRANFRNSDLSWDEMMDAAKQSGTNSTAQLTTLQATLKGDTGPAAGLTGAMLDKVMTLVEKNPAFAQTFRRILLTTLADPNALTRMKAGASLTPASAATAATAATTPTPPTDVMQTIVIEARNRAVLRDFKAASACLKPGASIALFYGAAHMKDLQSHLETDFGYRPADVQWLTALNAQPAEH